jgi:MATE family multidrug resistance protein
VQIVDVIMLGHLGREALAAAALGNTVFSMLYVPLNGLLTAYDTFGSQAYGMQDIAAVRYWVVVAFAVLTLVLVPITVVLAHGEDIVRSVFNQSDEIAEHVSGADTCLLEEGGIKL